MTAYTSYLSPPWKVQEADTQQNFEAVMPRKEHRDDSFVFSLLPKGNI